MEDIIIRDAELRDYEAVGRLLYEIAAQHREGRPDLFRPASRKYDITAYEALLAERDKRVFVADRDSEVVGYIICILKEVKDHGLFCDYTSLYIDDLCIDASARGMKVGTMLMKRAEEEARSLGCHNITLNVWEFNESARLFYDKMGYTTQRRIMELIL